MRKFTKAELESMRLFDEKIEAAFAKREARRKEKESEKRKIAEDGGTSNDEISKTCN